jgi:hypothetical protein
VPFVGSLRFLVTGDEKQKKETFFPFVRQIFRLSPVEREGERFFVLYPKMASLIRGFIQKTIL